MPQHVSPPLFDAAPRPDQGPAPSRIPGAPGRIVFLAHRDLGNPAGAGSELLVDQLALGLTEQGHDVTLLCGGQAARPYRVVSAGSALGHYVGARSAFARHIGSCDLLVEVCNGMPYLAPLWHRGPTVCLVNHVHTDLWDMRFPTPVARAGRRLEHWALSRAYRDHLMIAVSPSTAGALRELGVPRRPDQGGAQRGAGARPAGRALRHAAVRGAGPKLVDYKRIDLLLQLWERVRPVTGGLVIVGDGPERARLERLAGPGVEFAGRVTEAEKHRLLCASWLLLHPAAVEGWGLVVTEAAARSTPTLGFDVPGVRDSVEDGVTGVLARGASSFAAAWCALALDDGRREAMGRAARERAAEYRWASSVRRFAAVAAEVTA